MHGKTCVITGASGGIGLVTARALAGAGARVVALGRDRARTEAALRLIAAAVPPGGPAPEMLLADLSVQSEVRRAGREILERCPVLHVLVNNAGAYFGRVELTEDGIERTFALNHLGYFLLTGILRERLTACAPSRVVIVASRAHRGGRTDFETFAGPHRFGGWGAYRTSKLANVLFSAELARRLAGTGVTANSLHPGLVATGFGRRNPWPVRLGVQAFMHLGGAISPEAGAETPIYLASSPEVEGVSGRYYVACREAPVFPVARDPEAAARLWALSERLGARAPA